MAEQLCDVSEWRSCLPQPARIRVSQIMPAEVPNARGTYGRRKPNLRPAQRFALHVSYNSPGSVAARTECLQGAHGVIVQRDNNLLAVFCFRNRRCALLKVNIFPTKVFVHRAAP